MKRLLAIILAISLALSMAACGGSGAASGTSAAASSTASSTASGSSGASSSAAESSTGTIAPGTYTMNIGNVAATEHPVNKALREFKAAVEERTNGAVVVNIYENSVLGNELELLDQVISGSLVASVEMGGGNWAGYNGAANVSLLPFLFDSVDSARNAWNGAFGEKFTKDIIEPNGTYVLSYWENGMRHMTNNTRPIVEPEDMKGIKFRSSQTDMKIQMFEALGSSAIMIAFAELYTALQNGTVNGQENPASNIYSSSLFEVQKYLSKTNHMYDPSVFIVNPAWFDALPGEFQTIIEEEAMNAQQKDYEYNDETTYLDLLKEKGMEINEIDHDSFVGKMSGVWQKFADTYGQEWIDAATGK